MTGAIPASILLNVAVALSLMVASAEAEPLLLIGRQLINND